MSRPIRRAWLRVLLLGTLLGILLFAFYLALGMLG